jgi:starch synthase
MAKRISMKVCIVELIREGGMLHYASQMSNSLSKQANTTVYVVVPKGADVGLFNDQVQVRTVPTIGRHPFRIDVLLRHILDINPDVIHITIRHPLTLPLLPIFRALKIPVILTVHDVECHVGERSLIAEISTWFSTKLSNAIFIHDEKSKTKLISRGVPEAKLHTIPHGDYSFFTNYKTNVEESENNTVLFFGRILKYKGLEYLIKAEPNISKTIPGFKIIIAGEGDFSEYENMIVNRDRYEIINEYIPDTLVPDLFTRATVVILPYIEASQTGIVPIAYAFKKPVIATDVGALSEVVENGVTGLIVSPGDVDALSKSVIYLLENALLPKRMGMAGYNKMCREMSWDSISKRLLMTYTKAIEGTISLR